MDDLVTLRQSEIDEMKSDAVKDALEDVIKTLQASHDAYAGRQHLMERIAITGCINTLKNAKVTYDY